MLTIDDYQEGTRKTEVYGDSILSLLLALDHKDPIIGRLNKFLRIAYCAGKLNGEAGEIAEEVFKALRDDQAEFTEERFGSLLKELGDVMWYVSQLCTELGFKLEDVMDYNLAKLQDRKRRGVLHGSGDVR